MISESLRNSDDKWGFLHAEHSGLCRNKMSFTLAKTLKNWLYFYNNTSDSLCTVSETVSIHLL